MHCSRRTLRKIEFLISEAVDAVMVAGAVCAFGAVGNMDHAAEAHVPDDPHTMTLLIVGMIFLGAGSLYKWIVGEW